MVIRDVVPAAAVNLCFRQNSNGDNYGKTIRLSAKVESCAKFSAAVSLLLVIDRDWLL